MNKAHFNKLHFSKYRFKLRIFCWMASLLLVQIPTKAIEINDLYYTQVPISSASEAEKQKAFKTAAKQVLIKVSGNAAIADQQDVYKLLSKPEKLIQGFHYSEEILHESEMDDNISQLYLNVQLNEQAINDILTRTGQPIFGKNRPKILLWMVMENSIEQSILSDNDEHELRHLIKNITKNLGIPVLLPALTLNDLSDWNPSEIFNVSEEWYSKMKNRYGTDGVLVGYINVASTSQTGSQWQLLLKDNKYSWNHDKSDVNQNLTEAFHQLGSYLSLQFNPSNTVSGPHNYEVTISNINSLKDFKRIKSYLSSIEQANTVAISELTEDTVKFAVNFNGDKHLLARFVGLNHNFKPTVSEHLHSHNTLNYRWTD